jgi:hypothetical protein
MKILVSFIPKYIFWRNYQRKIFYQTYSISVVSRELSQYSVWLRDKRPGDLSSIPDRGERIFPLASVSRPALGPIQPPVQWVPGGPFPGAKAQPGRDADHSPHLVPRSRMSRSYTSSPSSAFMACSGTSLAFILLVWLKPDINLVLLNKYILYNVTVHSCIYEYTFKLFKNIVPILLFIGTTVLNLHVMYYHNGVKQLIILSTWAV